MELIFEIVSYHRLSPEQNSKISINNTLTIGRSENNDWHLPDPEKVVSGTHARVEKQADGFYIFDLSTNGLFINRSVEALGKSNSHKLCDGDLLTFGDYEVSVGLLNTAIPEPAISSTSSVQTPPLVHNKPIISQSVQGISPSALFDENPMVSNNTQKMPVVNNDLTDHFDVPQAIPEEWDIDFVGASPSQKTPLNDVVIPNAEPAISSNHETSAPVQSNAKQQQVTPPTANDNPDFDAFFKGLGISQAIIPEQFSDELLFEMGQGMRLMLMGLVDSLRTRTALKNEFRINQTTFQQQENNPLKFSATIDDVFRNLFLQPSSSFLPSTKAITEAFNDTKKHDIALTAGTLGAIEGIFNQLAPTEIEKKDYKESAFDQLIPGQKQIRYWKTYQSLHKDLVNEITAHGSSALSDDFVRAYDKKIKSL
ncbi:type VI secretion system-associated FHA domain protein TagH [Thalassotalea piscium]